MDQNSLHNWRRVALYTIIVVVYTSTAKMCDGQDKDNVAKDIRDNIAYVMQDCKKNDQVAWCSGTTNVNGMKSVSAQYYASEGMGGNGLTFDASQFWMTADLSSMRLKKFELRNGRDDKFVVELSDYDKPVTIIAPIE